MGQPALYFDENAPLEDIPPELYLYYIKKDADDDYIKGISINKPKNYAGFILTPHSVFVPEFYGPDFDLLPGELDDSDENSAVKAVGMITYLSLKGDAISYAFYTDYEKMKSEIKDCTDYGTPIDVTMYKITGEQLPINAEWIINNCSTPPTHYQEVNHKHGKPCSTIKEFVSKYLPEGQEKRPNRTKETREER